MSDTAIHIEGLGKSYQIAHQRRTHHNTFREDLMAMPKRLLSRFQSVRRPDAQPPSCEEFWALNNITFDVGQGEILGIVGRNGAGKSTLLKILSRITEPTSGRVDIFGRVGSLLEVGTGFHTELTGRENVFLNGAILGMSRREVKSKFDEIVAFADIERFLDTPVKRYSSGMFVRLAFAVAAHLDPEILIIDEVLAVGDADFQKKCLGKIKDVTTQEGRTVLFVSHHVGMISSLCSRAILLRDGVLAASGTPSEVIEKYLNSSDGAPHRLDFREKGKAPGDHLARLLMAVIEDESGTPVKEIDIRSPFRIRMEFELLTDVPKGPQPNYHFFDSRGEYAFVVAASSLIGRPAQRGIYTATCLVPGALLNDGLYSIGVGLTFVDRGLHLSFFERHGLGLNVVDPIEETLWTSRGGYAGPFPGPVRPDLKWQIERTSSSS